MKNQKLYILTGLPYSGKSTLAKELSNKFGFKVVSVDKIMYKYNMWEKEQLTQEDWNKAYSIAYRSLKDYLENDRSVVFDGGCLKFSERELLCQIAKSLQVQAVLIYVNTPVKQIIKRKNKNDITKQRGSLSDKELKDAMQMFEKPLPKENALEYNSSVLFGIWAEENIH